MPRGNPEISKHAKGRPKGSKNRTPILRQEFEAVIFEIPKEERMRRLRSYRDYCAVGNPHRNFIQMYSEIMKDQDRNEDQPDLFDNAEMTAMIAKAEESAKRIMERPGITN